MICSFCGTENREGNKFCGMCGVRIERRKAERRVNKDAELSCASCGHLNEPGHKFCAMCGTRVDRRMAERRGAQAGRAEKIAASGSGRLSSPVRSTAVLDPPGFGQRASDVLPRNGGHVNVLRSEPESRPSERQETGGIRGPSFLGLSDEPDDDPGYLLEEESRSRGGLRFLLILIILAAIAALVFLQYRSSLNAKPHPDPGRPSPSSQGQNQTAPAPDAQKPDLLPVPNGATPATPQSGQSPVQEPPAATPEQTVQPEPHVTPAKAETTLTAALDPPGDTGKPLGPDPPDADTGGAKNLEPVPAEQKPSPTLLRAQQFLHGRGVQQSCEQGLLYLRAAAQKNEPAAAVQMGALYASGQCVKQDRVMAYRWFNSAHELQPANQWISRNMDQLWGQMTEQERRLAGY